ncbi:hypothetical protein CFR78_05975 [Komagataeibacter rhaeticus]|uniref:DUF3293 domain-containing protein n=1 Tax=Komagataeibacter rhaeticus TaxID=215221 RepID=A0A181C7S1_9PROT|nr:DUF3293 domain-containing protein [Komagataeibacter rhaeticus]ATU73612.1 DUF3293 domain-containing protein [Komagataeibacter xylinus]EGG76247.1 hypothetical protein SXCC_03089 [Gluconacetobacter sp. SXCC-1]KDU95263.1 hypothetical protein GLUCORHAEAF1_08530 [Komagataeibacter rhaeticus AF1]MBL7240902.1 DUF3293 domain-containing protein [Komagataeibacter rhaeticus]PYD53949.1 hypothetical protein CFR78_05975 [Komagataeibacter rhaeticus]
MAAILPPTPAVHRSYRLSTYHVPGLPVVHIGHRPHWRGMVPRGDIVLLSACNPGGRRRADGWNRRMMRRLASALAGLPHVLGEGRLGRWSEPLYAVRVPLARGLVLARRFRQNAVVVLHGNRPARLVYLA